MQKQQCDDSNTKRGRGQTRNMAWVAAFALAMGSSVVFASACWVYSSSVMCCGTVATMCMKNGNFWPCSSTTDGTAIPVNLFRPANESESGRDTVDSVPAGNCIRTPVSCGAVPGECDAGTPYPVVCNQNTLSGSSCEGDGVE